jgi:fungal STAND N-terminal Goodbye domain
VPRDFARSRSRQIPTALRRHLHCFVLFSLNPSPDPSLNEQSDFFMSSTGQATSSANLQLIIDALADYAKITGIDLSRSPFVPMLEQSNSPEAILELLQEREKAFKDYRDGNRRLITCLTPVVNVLQAFSGIPGGAVSLVSHICHLLILLT